jgi:hypothetical protein
VFDQGNLIGEARKSEELSRTTEEQLNMWLERETGWKERDRRWKARWEKNEDVRCKEKLKLQVLVSLADTNVVSAETCILPAEHYCEHNVQGTSGQRRIQEIIRQDDKV